MPNAAGYRGGKVIYIDTENTFRPDRLRDICDRFNMDQTAMLENVLYARAYTSDHQMELLNFVAAKFHEVLLCGLFHVHRSWECSSCSSSTRSWRCFVWITRAVANLRSVNRSSLK